MNRITIGIFLVSMVFIAINHPQNLNAKGLSDKHAFVKDKNAEVKPKYQGLILEVLDAKAYTYLKIDEKIANKERKKLKSFWIVVDKSSAKVGDYVRFQKEFVTKNYTSKILNKTFDEIMFASQLEYRIEK